MLCSAGVLTQSDIRPEHFSVLLFSLLLNALERLRLGMLRPRPRWLLGLSLYFALWTSLHGGFVFGLVLLACYGAGGWVSRRAGTSADPQEPRVLAWAGLAAFAGTLATPYGWGPYEVLYEHWRLREVVTRSILEWAPVSLQNSYHWPFWPVLGACLGLIWRRSREKNIPLGLSAAALYFCLTAGQHGRLASYLNPLAAVLIGVLARDMGWWDGRLARRLGWAALVYAAYLGWVLSHFPRGKIFVPRFIPVAAAEFLDREREVFSRLRVYNPWEWGGYLGWRLAPWHRVFYDGRYIFHPLLGEAAVGGASSQNWREFFDRHGVEAALLDNIDKRFPSEKVYPDGRRKAFLRPWYLYYMPRERWALVYWDEQALLFVERGKVPPAWLAAREYRYVRPRDDEAFFEAVERKEIPLARVEDEERRLRSDRLTLPSPY